MSWRAIRCTAKTPSRLAGSMDFRSRAAARSENRFLMFDTGLIRSSLKPIAPAWMLMPPVWRTPAASAAPATAAMTTAGNVRTLTDRRRRAASVGSNCAGSQRAAAPKLRKAAKSARQTTKARAPRAPSASTPARVPAAAENSRLCSRSPSRRAFSRRCCVACSVRSPGIGYPPRP